MASFTSVNFISDFANFIVFVWLLSVFEIEGWTTFTMQP